MEKLQTRARDRDRARAWFAHSHTGTRCHTCACSQRALTRTHRNLHGHTRVSSHTWLCTPHIQRELTHACARACTAHPRRARTSILTHTPPSPLHESSEQGRRHPSSCSSARLKLPRRVPEVLLCREQAQILKKPALPQSEVCWDEVPRKPLLRRLTPVSLREREDPETRECVSGVSEDTQAP